MYKRTAKIKILDEVNVVVIGVHQEHVDILHEMFGLFAPNYFFNPKYKLGSWDGKIRFFSKTGKTYKFLLPQILPKLQQWGYTFDLIDNRTTTVVPVEQITKDYFSHIKHGHTGEPIELRYYQVEAVNALIDNAGGIVVAGTGAGKTMANAALVDVYGKKGLKTYTIVQKN